MNYTTDEKPVEKNYKEDSGKIGGKTYFIGPSGNVCFSFKEFLESLQSWREAITAV